MSMRNGEWIPLEVSISKRFWYERNERERGVGRRGGREREKGRLPILPPFFLALSLTIDPPFPPLSYPFISESSSYHRLLSLTLSLTQSWLIHFTHFYTLFCCSAIEITFTRRLNEWPPSLYDHHLHLHVPGRIVLFIIELGHDRPTPRCPLKQCSLFLLLSTHPFPIPSDLFTFVIQCDPSSFFRFPSIEKRREVRIERREREGDSHPLLVHSTSTVVHSPILPIFLQIHSSVFSMSNRRSCSSLLYQWHIHAYHCYNHPRLGPILNIFLGGLIHSLFLLIHSFFVCQSSHFPSFFLLASNHLWQIFVFHESSRSSSRSTTSDHCALRA